MLLAHDILLDLQLKHAVVDGDLHLLMRLNAAATHELLTLDTLWGGVAFSLINNLAYVAEGHFRRPLGQDELIEAAHKKVVVKFAAAARRYHRFLAANRTRKLAVVGVLVGPLRAHMLLDALLAERVQTRQTLGVLVVLVAYFARQKLVVYLLGQLDGLALLWESRHSVGSETTVAFFVTWGKCSHQFTNLCFRMNL